MSKNQESDTPKPGRSVWVKSLLICGILLGVAVGVNRLIFSTEPEAVREGATKKSAMLVEVTRGEQGSFQPKITVMGTVTPSRDITLSPLMNGEIIECAPGFTPGGMVKKGDVLLKIDPADYEIIVLRRQSELRHAEANLAIELGRQNVALKDYELMEETLTAENENLILRKPQLSIARAEVESARAAVAQAELDVRRTTIKAPFDAHVLSRNVNLGSLVAPGHDLGRLVGLETYWVEATAPLSALRRLSFPRQPGETGSVVRIRNRSAWPEDVFRAGHLYKWVGALEERTRMARVLVSVQDPLSQTEANRDAPPLMIGAYVTAHIQADPLPDVIRLKRDYLRKDNSVWVNQGGTLDIRDVEIVYRDAEYAYIRNGLGGDDWVVTTHLSKVKEGAPLRVRDEPSEPKPETSP